MFKIRMNRDCFFQTKKIPLIVLYLHNAFNKCQECKDEYFCNPYLNSFRYFN